MSSQNTEAGALAIKGELTNVTTGAFLSEEQQNYAVARVNMLCQEQLDAFYGDNPLPFDNRPILSLDEKFTLLKEGKAKLIDLSKKKKACQLPKGDNSRWSDLYDFGKTDDQKAWDLANDKRGEYRKALETKRDEAIDQIMLGTNASVGRIVAEFGVGAPDPTKAPVVKLD